MAREIQLKEFCRSVTQMNISVVEVELPKILENEVLVKMKLSPINPADIFALMGVYPGFIPKYFPAVPGAEGVGIVQQIGSKVTKGDRVYPHIEQPITGKALWRDYVNINENNCILIPDKVTDESAAQLVVNPCTVLAMIETLNIPKGKYLLQNGSGSILGRQLIQYCKHLGIKTINIVRRVQQENELKALGADYVIQANSENTEEYDSIVEKIRSITNGEMAYAAVDAVGGKLGLLTTSSVRDEATILLYGLMDGDGSKVLFKEINYKGFYLSKYFCRISREEKISMMKKVLKLFEDGVISPMSGEKIPLNDIKEALKKCNEEGRGGKILLQF